MLSRFPPWIYLAFFAVGLALGMWRIWAWAPERYVPAKFDTFVERIEKNRWRMAGWLVADGYSDRWGFNKQSMIDSGRSVFRHFQWIEIRRSVETWSFGRGSATVTIVLELRGEGNQIATIARDTASEATEPFTFTFRKMGVMPWSWKLVSVEQPQLRLSPNRSSF